MLWISPKGLDIPSIAKPFRFEEMWLLDRGCSEIVEAVWCSNVEELNVIEEVTYKIKKCGKELGRWNRTHFNNARQELGRK